MKNLIFLLFACSMVLSCDNDNNTFQEQLDIDIAIIEEYLDNNGITNALNDQGVYYVIEEEGTGSEYPVITSLVSMAYAGHVMGGDGTIFDSTTAANPLKSQLTNLIVGWRLGVPKFKKGGKGTLYIPSGYAYGEFGRGADIPPNSILIFDIELLDFSN